MTAAATLERTDTAPDPAEAETTTLTYPPKKYAQFVAYEATVRQNTVDGRRVELRPEVLVRQFAGATIVSVERKSHTRSDGGEFATLTVKIDPSPMGIGMNNAVSAVCADGTGLARLILWAHQNTAPLHLSVEVRRRVTNLRTKDKIPFDASILALRSDESGTPNANRSHDNTVNVIVAAGVLQEDGTVRSKLSPELLSDINEWPDLFSNRAGGTPPKGPWRHVGDADAKTSVLIRDTESSTAGGFTAQDVQDAAAAAAAETLRQHTATHNTAPAAASSATGEGQAPAAQNGQPRGRAVEATPYQLLNTDGRVNAGSTLVTRLRAMWVEAADMIDGSDEMYTAAAATGDIDAVYRRIAAALLWAADRVQEAVTGGVSRGAKSHYEAAMWVSTVITKTHPYPLEAVGSGDAARATHTSWIRAVVTDASGKFRAVVALAADLLQVDAGMPDDPYAAVR